MVLVNSFEVLDMAIRLERIGILYYGKAAAQADDAKMADLLNRLVDMDTASTRRLSPI